MRGGQTSLPRYQTRKKCGEVRLKRKEEKKSKSTDENEGFS